MNLYNFCTEHAIDSGAIIILLMTLIQIAPIQINPWSSIFALFGKVLNKDLNDCINDLRRDTQDVNERVQKLSHEFHENLAIETRNRILRFGDELCHGQNHSHEHFKQILADIDNYEKYCKTHPNFLNNMTTITTEKIRSDFKKKENTNDFL